MENGHQPFYKTQVFQDASQIMAVSVVAIIGALFSAGKVDCGDKNDLIVPLATIEERAEGIQAAICIVDGKDVNGNSKYEIETFESDEERVERDRMVELGEGTDNQRFTTSTYISYFRIIDINTKEVVTDFPEGIELYFFYTEEALANIKEEGRDLGFPRVGALAIRNDQVSGTWEELGGSLVKEIDLRGFSFGVYERVLVIKLWALPDPLIGGC